MRNRGAKGTVVALALGLSGLAACGGSGTDDDTTTVQSNLTASPANPVAFCQASGLHVIIGTSGNDVINGTGAADCIVGLGGQDRINGLGGNDIIFGGDGDDVLVGGDGDDRLFGGAGNDMLVGGSGDDRLDGGDGNDALSDCQHHNTFIGGAGGTNTCQGNRNGSSSSSFTACSTVVACPGA